MSLNLLKGNNKYNIKEMEAIVAVNKRNVIGRENKLIWNIPEDLKHFRRKTENEIIIMGRKTYESLPRGGLKNRINIVLTGNPERYKEEEHNNLYFTKLENLEEKMEKYKEKKKIVIGGSEIYELFIERYDKVYLTKVYNEEEGDAYNPITEERLLERGFKIKEREPIEKSKKTDERYEYITYEKI